MASTTCVAVGTFTDSQGARHGAIETLQGTTWTAREAPEPSDAGNDASHDANARLTAVDCTGSGNCVAVGSYENANGYTWGLIETEAGGTWSAATAQEATAGGLDQAAQLQAVSCSGTGSCVAVGQYTNFLGEIAGLIEVLSGGSWSDLDAPRPADFNFDASLAGVSCPAAGSCVAVGSYYDTSDHREALLEQSSSGTWATVGETARLPSGAGTDANDYLDASLASVGCPTVAFCVAGGTYATSTGVAQGLIDTYIFGGWQAAEAPTPANAGTDVSGAQAAAVSAVACPTTATCAVVGNYWSTGHAQYPLVDQFVGTSWELEAAPEPANTGSEGASRQSALLDAAACPAAGVCTAVGYYEDSAGEFQGLIEQGSGTTWTPVEAPLPSSHATQPYTNLYAVSCAAAGSCVAGGSFADASGNFEGLFDVLATTAASGGGGMPTPPVQPGYDLVGSDGGVFVFGHPGQGFYGSLPGLGVTVHNVVGIVPTSDYQGYFLVGSDGGVFAFGDTTYEGSLPGLGVHTNDIVGIVPTTDDKGYFLVGSDGGVFAFGDAPFENSLPGLGVHVDDIVGIAPTADDGGYWVVSSTGTVYNLGDAGNYGSLAGSSPTPIVGITATKSSGGYWLVGADGAVFPYGNAASAGDLPGLGVTVGDVVAIVPTPSGAGYWLIGSDGGIFAFGDATEIGSLPGLGVSVHDIVGAVPTA